MCDLSLRLDHQVYVKFTASLGHVHKEQFTFLKIMTAMVKLEKYPPSLPSQSSFLLCWGAPGISFREEGSGGFLWCPPLILLTQTLD